MLKLTSEIKVAINLINLLTYENKSIISLSEEIGISYTYLKTVTLRLSKGNIIASEKGKGGGVKLLIPNPTLFDLATAFYSEIPVFDESIPDQRINSVYVECLKFINIRKSV